MPMRTGLFNVCGCAKPGDRLWCDFHMILAGALSFLSGALIGALIFNNI